MTLANPDLLPVHPWQSRAEILQVIQSIRTDDVAAWKTAVACLRIWEIRLGARFLEIYRVTRDVLLNMIEYIECDEICNLNSLGLTLSRFVDVFTEKGKKEMAQEFTVLEMARQVDIPDWIVDIRHDIVHRALPSPCLLCKTLKFAKQYLWTHYWSEVYLEIPLSDLEVREDFMNFLQSVIENKENNTKSIQTFIKKLSLEQYKIVPDVISEFLLELCEKEDRCKDKCIKSYMPVFSDLSRYGLISQLLKLLVDRLVTQPDSNLNIMRWIMAIIKKAEEQLDDDVITYMRKQCVRNIGSTTIQLLTLLSEIPPDDQGLSSLVTLYKNTPINEQADLTDFNLHTIEDLSLVREERIITSRIQDTWYRDDDKDWRKIPLGYMFNFTQSAPDPINEQVWMTECENDITEIDQSIHSSQSGNQSNGRTKFGFKDIALQMF